MRINNLSFPHPVLGNADDVGGVFRATLEVSLNEAHADLKITHHLSNGTIEGLISEGKALFNVEIFCRQTFYRESFMSNKNELDISIPSDKLRNNVDLNFFITAACDIPEYEVSESNGDYKGYKFDVSEGDLIGYGGSSRFMAAKDWGALSTVTSFMEIEQYDKDSGPAMFVLTDSKVVIRLSREDYKRYLNCKGNRNLNSLFHSSIVLPALMYVLQNMEKDEENKESDWFQNLDFRLSNEVEFKNLDRTNPDDNIRIAQLLLKNPIGRMLSDTDKLMEAVGSE